MKELILSFFRLNTKKKTCCSCEAFCSNHSIVSSGPTLISLLWYTILATYLMPLLTGFWSCDMCGRWLFWDSFFIFTFHFRLSLSAVSTIRVSVQCLSCLCFKYLCFGIPAMLRLMCTFTSFITQQQILCLNTDQLMQMSKWSLSCRSSNQWNTSHIEISSVSLVI